MKDRSPVVHDFLALFRAVKEGCKDEPSRIEWLIQNKNEFEKLCEKLYWSAYTLKHAERSRSQLYIENVAKDFRDAWREFEGDYEDEINPLNKIFRDIDVSDLLDDGVKSDSTLVNISKYELLWEKFDEDASGIVEGLDAALLEQEGRLESRKNPDGSRTGEDWVISNALDGLEELRRAGLDIRGIYRRRNLCPVVFLPLEREEIPYSDGKYRELLRTTQDAFIFGSFSACAALLRANLEAILKGLWNANGEGLKGKIMSIKSTFDKPLLDRLWYIKNIADDVLHGNKGAKAAYDAGMKTELELLAAMTAVRSLLESPPQKGATDA